MSDWWTPSRDANLLALGLARQVPPPASTFDAINFKFTAFERKYLELSELLKRDNKSIDVLDALTHPPLSQTLDEYNDFKYDADILRRDAGSFSKRKLEVPFLPYKVARYVYTDADIHQLNTKMNWQIRIMDGKMDDMVLSYFILVHRRSQVRPSSNDHDSSSLANTLRGPQNQKLTGLSNREDDDDANIIHLWERVESLSNRLTRTSPHVQSRIDSNDTPPRLSPEEISRVIEPLKARFKNTASADSARIIESIAEDQLAAYSQNRLNTLLSSFPDFTTRKRVYFKDEPKSEPEDELKSSSRQIFKAKSVQNQSFDSGKVATMELQPTRFKFNLTTLDIVRFRRQTVIVCTDEHRNFGALHYLPQHPVIYPSTNTRRVDASKHDTEVCIEEECLIQLTGSKDYSVQEGLAMYNFPLKEDMFAFQCALREKLIRHAFDVDFIESKRGLETAHQHLKIWSDFNNENYTLSFYVKKRRAHETYLEFPMECFVPTPAANHGKQQLVRIYFRLQPESSKSKRSSRDSIMNVNSPPGARKTKERMSFSRIRPESSETSPTQSMFKRFGKSRRPSETHLSLSPPTGRIDQRSSSSSGSVETQSTDNTATESMVSVSVEQDPNVHPDAKIMQYLDFKFSISTDAGLFITEFRNATKETISRIHFRSDSIYEDPRHRSSALLSEKTVAGKMATSPEIVTPADLRSQLVRAPQVSSPPPAMSKTPHADMDLGISFGDVSAAEDHSISTQAFAFEDHQSATRDPQFKYAPIAPDPVYRVRGIPIDYQVHEFKNFLASKFEMDPSEIDVRSLATNPGRKTQTAIVIFENVPSVISSKEDNWSFKWKMTEGKKASHIQIDTHFNGLTMLYTPPEGTKHEIDICAVAGLGDSAFESFEETGKGGSYMWVLDLLQDYFAGARIMLYGCHMNSSGSGSSSVLETLAGELIDSLNDLDDDAESQASSWTDERAGNLPLIFIGYSLAGQVIKQAVVTSAEQQDDDNFYKSVYGALFFGVPSQAMETTALDTLLKDQASVFLDMSDQKNVQILNDRFNSVIEREDLHMQYFYETEETLQLEKDPNDRWRTIGATKLLVTESSATNISASEQSSRSAKNFHSIKRNHLRLVKWRAHDPECPMVIRILKTMKTKALVKHGGRREIVSSPDLLGESSFQPPSRRPPGFASSSRAGTGFQQPSRTATGFASQRTTQSETVRATGSLSTKDYHVGWICAVGPEYVAALQLLDTRLSRPFDLSEDDENAYSFGIIGDHHVVIAGLAEGKYGLTSAASAATDMLRSFRSIHIGLMVGIAGGAPSKKHDIRLGDVVVSKPGGQRGGVFRYDSGRTIQNKAFVTMGSLNSPPEFLLKALMKLKSLHRIDGHSIKSIVENMLERNPRLRSEYQKPDLDTDVLYKSSFIHSDNDQSCLESCFHHKERIVPRPDRDLSADDPVVHFGLIASGDQLMKDASVRDALVEKEEVLCFEMEAAGLMNRFPCLVIRGICDYSDTHKNDLWQGYAAATAAAYAKELLLLALAGKRISEDAVSEAPSGAEDDL